MTDNNGFGISSYKAVCILLIGSIWFLSVAENRLNHGSRQGKYM